ncbi:uncharacterized protein LOC121838221, partial [Ixodes scapularis]|uniref:uncharacterized protein LOC121838221 n=1 Tax=Ixodes scapularis TaxID=6945 RepID=UPI001C386A5C
SFQQRSQKPVLNFSSHHSKTVKSGREILESLHIKSSVSNLSSPSLSLSDREIRFLRCENVPRKT